MLKQFVQRMWNPSAPTEGKTIPLHPIAPVRSDETTSVPAKSAGPTRRMVKLIMVMAGNNNKYYEMCENDDDTFTVHYGRVGGIRTTVRYPMAHWDKKIREKMAQGYVESLAIEPVTDNYTLKLIRRMMGPNAARFDAAFSVRHAVTDPLFSMYVHQRTNRQTLALWHGTFEGSGYLSICEVHVGNQLDALKQEPRYVRLTADALKHMDTQYGLVFTRQESSPQTNEFVVNNPTQCTVRYLVRINA